jgi:hypothetical protein
MAACDAPHQARESVDKGVPGALVACASRAYEVSDIDVDSDPLARAGNVPDQFCFTIVRRTPVEGVGSAVRDGVGTEGRGLLQAASPASWGVMSVLSVLFSKSYSVRVVRNA